MAIKPLLLAAFEAALNRYLSLDQDSAYFLEPLAGKVIAVTVQPFDDTIYLCPTADSIQCLDYYPDQPDTRLIGSLSALGLMGLSATPMRSVFSGEVKIEGDMQTGRKFQELFAKLDIDLEEKLSQFTGDIVAHKVANLFRAKQNWNQETLETFKLNAKEFLQEETRDLPSAPEVEIHYAQVDELRTDYDRLESRVERLKSILQNKF
ncbi:MAG: ubiquinone biosynthesis accessory factor UbiJ [Methylobacter sp.]